MAWKFLNIGKANAEIERLETALAAEQAKVTTLTQERDAAKTALAENDSEIAKNAAAVQTEITQVKAERDQAKADLGTAKTTIATLTQERDEAKAKLTDPKGTIQSAATTKAAEITAAQGQPPIAAVPTTAPGQASTKVMKRSDFNALSPKEKSEFMRAGGRLTD
jgi:chromosome segregation ATPase